MLNKNGVTESGDVYQIGVVLYEMLVGIPPFYNDNITVLYNNIKKGKLKIPKYLSKNSKNLLVRILHKDQRKRPNLERLKSDPFFEGIDWEELASKRMAPPTVLGKIPNNPCNDKKESLDSIFISTKRGEPVRPLFEDSDYSENDKSYNRVKSYSFERPRRRRSTVVKQ